MIASLAETMTPIAACDVRHISSLIDTRQVRVSEDA